VPDYPCTEGANIQCAIKAAEKHFGKGLKKLQGQKTVEEHPILRNIRQVEGVEGGAYDENFLFR
jgi:hypothetical protein